MFNLKNRLLVWKYPYLRPRDCDGNEVPDYDYSTTELDSYPVGWRKLLLGYCERLNEVLNNHNELGNFRIVEAKEKWGAARLYYGGVKDVECRKEIDWLLDIMEKQSSHVCSQCGKEAEFISRGYVLPYCRDCAIESKSVSDFRLMDVDAEEE